MKPRPSQTGRKGWGRAQKDARWPEAGGEPHRLGGPRPLPEAGNQREDSAWPRSARPTRARPRPPRPTPIPLGLRRPGTGAGTHLEVVPVPGPALGGRVPRLAQQRAPDGSLRVPLEELHGLLGLGQQLLLKLQPRALRLLPQPVGLLQDARLLDRAGQGEAEAAARRAVLARPGPGCGVGPGRGPRKDGEGMGSGGLWASKPNTPWMSTGSAESPPNEWHLCALSQGQEHLILQNTVRSEHWDPRAQGGSEM